MIFFQCCQTENGKLGCHSTNSCNPCTVHSKLQLPQQESFPYFYSAFYLKHEVSKTRCWRWTHSATYVYNYMASQFKQVLLAADSPLTQSSYQTTCLLSRLFPATWQETHRSGVIKQSHLASNFSYQCPPFCTICVKRLVMVRVVSMKRSTQFCRQVSVR